MVTSSSTLNDTLVTTSDLLEFPDTDRLITDVIWATETHSHLLFKQTNRVQDIEVTNLVALNSTNLNSTHVKHVRTYKPSDGGWIDSAQTMIYMPNQKPNDTTVRYLDVVDNGKRRRLRRSLAAACRRRIQPGATKLADRQSDCRLWAQTRNSSVPLPATIWCCACAIVIGGGACESMGPRLGRNVQCGCRRLGL